MIFNLSVHHKRLPVILHPNPLGELKVLPIPLTGFMGWDARMRREGGKVHPIFVNISLPMVVRMEGQSGLWKGVLTPRGGSVCEENFSFEQQLQMFVDGPVHPLPMVDRYTVVVASAGITATRSSRKLLLKSMHFQKSVH